MTKPLYLAWIDIETTGLKMNTDHIIEIGFMISDLNLDNPRLKWTSPVLPNQIPAEDIIAKIDADNFIRNMHTTTGLRAELVRGNYVTHGDAQREIMGTLDYLCGDGPKDIFLMAGSGVAAFDKPWMDFHFPGLRKYFQYKTFDVGHMRRFIEYTVERADLVPESPPDEHRAMADVESFYGQALAFKRLFNRVFPEPRIER